MRADADLKQHVKLHARLGSVMNRQRDQGEEQLLTPQQAAKYLNISVRTLAEWRRRGIGPPSIKLPSGARRYRRADLDRWIETHREDG
jgi:excisionase family DNA binding protein